MSSRRSPPLNSMTSSRTCLRTLCGPPSDLGKQGEQSFLAVKLVAAARFSQAVAVEEEQFPEPKARLGKAELHASKAPAGGPVRERLVIVPSRWTTAAAV